MKISTFRGIHNTVSPRDIPDESVQDAVDVDITDAGGFIARSGHNKVATLALDAAYTTATGRTYVVSGGSLQTVSPGPTLTTIAPSTATEFCDSQNILFTNDGLMVYGEMATNLRVPVGRAPEIVITGGSKLVGRYNILTTYTNNSGREGGTGQVVTVELDNPGEILATPQEIPGCTANVYMTDVDGEVFYDVASGRKLLPDLVGSGVFPEQGTCIEFHEAKLFVAEDFGDYTVIRFSRPLVYHLFPDKDYFIVPTKVTAMKSAGSGLIIGTADLIYVYADRRLEVLADYGAVPGRSMLKLPTGQVLIHSVRGVCKALPFEELTQDKVSLPMGSTCNVALMHSNGVRKYVALHDGVGEAFNKFTN
jgi:hypothetical protein